MDETTFQDAEVIQFINERFVPIKVDNDHRPEINLRYNVGGWPTTAFLSGHGGMIAGATYLPPDQLLAMLREVDRAYQEQKPQLYDQANSLFRRRQDEAAKIAAGQELEPALVQRIARRSAGLYDPINGGFGEEPKFPGAPLLRLYLHLLRTTGEEFYRIILEKSLNSILDGELYDSMEGGFFRYCAQADWSEAQHEKMVEDNVGLTQVFIEAWLQLGADTYRQAASTTIDYLLRNLYDQQVAGFRGSQGAHSDYFSLAEQERQHTDSPPADRFSYTNWSAQAASLLLQGSWALSRPELFPLAERVLGKMVERSRSSKVSHAFAESWEPREIRPQLLTDWASLLNALMDAHNCGAKEMNYLQEAEKAAGTMIELFHDGAAGGFFDTEQDAQAVGYLKLREKPLPENVLAAQGLLKLHQATLKGEHRDLAQGTLSAFVEANRHFGEFASSYALTVDRFLNSPIEITVEGLSDDKETFKLLRTAYGLRPPNLVVKPELSAEHVGRPQAHVCLDTVCLPPVSDPESLEQVVENWFAGGSLGQPDPFENIFEKFPGI